MFQKVELFKNKKECCGCGACASVCVQKAILMRKDESGFIYPQIDESKCVGCMQCKNICAYQGETVLNKTINAYAAIANDEKILKTSASGGVFSMLAKNFILKKGLACGASMEYLNGSINVQHKIVCKADDIYKLQGSKYVQSDIGKMFIEIKNKLNQGTEVLFSGTPCQVDALKKYIGNHKKLYTIDIICHGVPSMQMLSDYICIKEKKLGGNITDYVFRYKDSEGETKSIFKTKITYSTKQKETNYKFEMFYLSSYYNYFLKSEIYRESCYTCKYACGKRVADITMGDYWEINTAHAEDLASGKIKSNASYSCVLVNSQRGQEVLKKYGDGLDLISSNFESIAKANSQLVKPSKHSELRTIILDKYINGGYAAVEKQYKNSLGIKYYYLLLKSTFLKK